MIDNNEAVVFIAPNLYPFPAGAGMINDDEGGIRRSSRARIRPLEYWRNEHKVSLSIHSLHVASIILIRLPSSGA